MSPIALPVIQDAPPTIEVRSLVYQRGQKMVSPHDKKWWTTYDPDSPYSLVVGPEIGTFRFLRTLNLKEKWTHGQLRNELLGVWRFEGVINFPEFTASQLCDALNWANRNGIQVLEYYRGEPA